VLAARVDTGWLSYGLSAGGGLLVGLVYGGMNPNSVRREDAWMMTALPLGPAGAVGATYLQREVLGGAASLGDAAAVGATAAGVLLVPMSLALVRLWDEAHGLTRAAMLFLHNENFAPKAVSFLDRALALAPDDPAVLNLRGVAWSKMDEPERAAADWERAAALRPTDADPLMNVGVDRLRRGDLDAAVTALEAAIRIDGGNATAHSNLGAALERRGDLDRAVEHYDRAIALRPDYANAFSNRGYARFRRGEHREAVDDCDRALALDPNLAQAVVNRAHALGALGQRGEAAASYARALEMQSSPAVQEEALRGLTALGAPAVEHAE
jgi:tetratricopeptide (TPR) repeat protein